MRRFRVGRVLVLAVLLVCVGSSGAQQVPGPTSNKPFDEKWAPVEVGRDRPGGLRQPHEQPGEHQARARDRQAEQGHHDRQVLPPRGARLRPARVADEHSRHAHRRPVRQERAHLPRRARDHRDRPDPDAVRRPRPHRREHLEGPDHVQRRESPGTPTSAAPAGAWWAWARSAWSTSASSASSAASSCSMRSPTRSPRARSPRTPRCCRFPTSRATPAS